MRKLKLVLSLGLLSGCVGLLLAITSNPTRAAGPAALPTVQLFLPYVQNRVPRVTPPPSGTWLTWVNYYRATAHIPTLYENTSWSDGGWKHSRYMVKNDYIGHSEVSGNPWYTAEGLAAAQNGNVMVSSNVNASDRSAIDLWMAGPFHAVGILDPRLTTTGFGSYREAGGSWAMGATLDVIRGRGTLIPKNVAYPIRWPDIGSFIYLLSYGGNEAPDPLTNCAGYAAPTGLPIILQLGSGNITPSVTATSFKQGNTSLEHCTFNETNYINSNPDLQSLGRSVLNARDAIILIPRQPLSVGLVYDVSITANGQTHAWAFTTTTAPAGLDAQPEGVSE